MRSTDPRLEEATARKIALLQEDLAIKVICRFVVGKGPMNRMTV